MSTILIHNVETGEVVERPKTQAELEQEQKDLAVIAAEQAEKVAKAQKRAALLEKLGITEDEARVLLG